MASILQSSMGLLKSKLSRKIVGWVFLSLATIEVAIFIPSYFKERSDRLEDLEEISQEVLFTIKNNVMGDMAPGSLLASGLGGLKPDSVILGATLYTPEGDVIETFGDPPELEAEEITNGWTGELTDGGTRYDVSWPAERFADRYIVAIRHDATSVRAQMRQYSLGIALLVILISVFVTLMTILVLERLLINPLLHLRDDLNLAAAAVKRNQPPRFRSLAEPRNDELGEVAQAFGDMFQRIAQEIRERQEAEAALRVEQEKSDQLLLNILPPSIAAQLKNNLTNRGAIASRFESVTILFADIVGFTRLATEVSPVKLVCQLNSIFSAFDSLAENLGLEKIKTIGDAYMVVGGLPEPMSNHAEACIQMAVAMQAATKAFYQESGQCFQLRIGVHTGPVVAGVIGIKKFSYDLWGDAVNVASRMESHGVVNRIQVSEATYQQLKHRFAFEDRGHISIKGRGQMHTYLLKTQSVPQAPPASSRPHSLI
ncbi:MAG: adenylate/guanylate cyclase domain-containing protein [Cyanobacteria bacterium J06627_15]